MYVFIELFSGFDEETKSKGLHGAIETATNFSPICVISKLCPFSPSQKANKKWPTNCNKVYEKPWFYTFFAVGFASEVEGAMVIEAEVGAMPEIVGLVTNTQFHSTGLSFYNVYF